MRSLQKKRGSAAEGVTLSGFRKDEDCKWIELWRIPIHRVPKVQGGTAQSLRQKDKVNPSKGVLLLFDGLRERNPFFLFLNYILIWR